MAEILGKDLDNYDESLAARQPFSLSESDTTGPQFMTGADLVRSAKISSEWREPVAIKAQAYAPIAKLSQPVLSAGRSMVDSLVELPSNVANLVAQSVLESTGRYKPIIDTVSILADKSKRETIRKAFEENQESLDKTIKLLSGRDYSVDKWAKRVIANSTANVENRKIVRELYNQAQGIDSSKWYNEAGAIIGAMVPTMVVGNTAFATSRAFGAGRAAATKIATAVAKGYIGAEMAGQYAEETAAQYLEKTGDKNFENFTAKDASGLSAAAYGAIGAQIEFMGGVEPIMAGALTKVGLRSAGLKAAAKIGAGEATEELLQGLTEILFRKIEGTTDKTWKEGFEESLKGAAWGLFIGGTMGTTAFHVNRRNLVKGIKTALPNISDTQAQLVADAMIDSTAEISSQDPTLRGNLRQKIDLMYRDVDMENKADRIDAITDLEYSLISMDAAERGIDLAEHELFAGEVNELGWFREGIPEARRAEIQEINDNIVDLKSQLTELNKVQEKDWAKIEEIENKLAQANQYVLEKLSDLARDDAGAVRRILQGVEDKYVEKEKEKSLDSFEASPEQKELASGAASFVADTLANEGFEVQVVGGQGKKRAHGSSYLLIRRPGMSDLKIRIGVTPIGAKHSAVALNLNAEKLSQEEMLNKIRELIKQKFVKSNKATNVNIGFGEEPMFQEQFDLADENARLDDIYPEYTGETIEVDGKERTVYNSNGDKIADSAEALTNFWRWFGDSKVVDEQGRPLVVYHGTNSAPFNTFEIQSYYEGFSDDPRMLRTMHFFSTNEKVGKGFGANLYKTYLKIENPSVFDESGGKWNAIKEATWLRNTPLDSDGIIVKNIREGSLGDAQLADDYIVFKSTQIKSVDNRGTFSSDTGNIYLQNRVSGGAPATYRGAYIPEYRFILRANRMDASTLSHELAHDWFEVNFDRYRSGNATKDFMRAWGSLEKALGVPENATIAPRKASEAFARAYEAWVVQNEDWAKLINVEDKDKDAVEKLLKDYQSDLRDIYNDISNPYFKQTWGRLGELKPELKAWFDRVVNITDLDVLAKRGEMTESEVATEKLNRAIDTVIENTEDAETAQTLKEARTLNDTSRYEAEGGNKNSLQRRLSALAQEIDENNMIVKGEKYDTRRDMLAVAQAADNFVKTRLDDALAIINGQMAEVEGLYKEDLYTALERLAVENGDLGLIDELKNSEVANRLAKELGQRVAGFRNFKQSTDLDVVSALKSLDNKFNEALKNKKAQKEFDSALKLLDDTIKQQDKIADKELDNFLTELECK